MLTRNTLMLALTGCVLALSPAVAQPVSPFIAQWDLDGDARVTAQEIQTRRADIFVMFDQNEDGILADEELDMMRETSAGQQESMAEERAEYQASVQAGMQGMRGQKGMRGMGGMQGRQSMGGPGADHDDVAMADANHDGQLTRDEFMAAAEVQMKMLDRNADGVIDAQDWPMPH